MTFGIDSFPMRTLRIVDWASLERTSTGVLGFLPTEPRTMACLLFDNPRSRSTETFGSLAS